MDLEAGYLSISFSHKNTEITMREKLSFASTESIKNFLQTLKSKDSHLKEIILLSTCNRFEIYAYTDSPGDTKNFILSILAQIRDIDEGFLQEIADVFIDQGAVHHLFCVASSLDSIVVGETQIGGQLKSAYKLSFDNGFCGKNLTRLIHFAFRCAAQVRNSTQISQNAVSVASVAVKEANVLFEKNNIKNKVAIVVGVGDMGILASKHLLHLGYRILLLNRNKQNALNVSNELNSEYNDMVEVRDFSTLSSLINEYPLLFCATSAPHCIIQNSMIKTTSFQRFWFDLAVPRDIENPNREDIFLFSVDDLQQVASENLVNRRKNTTKAYEVVGIFTLEFFKWLQTLGVDPLIKKIREFAKEASLKELERAVKKGFIPSEYEDNVAKVLHGAFNIFLHKPTINIKNFADKEEADPIIEAMKAVFDIDDEVMLINRYKCEYDTTLN
ncbi:glutamyl-tRNA reductase [Helicobacter cappadocius]|uniref:Glutamyl-tRNA reductase n=1 Tax=Helicobacter cappadocius TaxID=3063998 RepID=A0AA90PWD0_9HELI|nr:MULTISPECIES: glutamyl-tRNA reductase [unclassified Helicobacter]MDO7253587.1 glutamyl-tRNA reductase [Helicobacter sp. faydin-H75]MDP2539515.1 glutamyl-tRNA reductase [Helicobacter sp. faydin-H76]